MIREIKFRAWLPYRKLMGLVTEISLRNDNYQPTQVQVEYHYELGENTYGLNKRQQQFTSTTDFNLMQFTSLRDKNGADIYEGDIVSLSEEFDEDRFYAVEYQVNGYWLDGWDGNEYGFPDGSNLEVIGNIYENPELIK